MSEPTPEPSAKKRRPFRRRLSLIFGLLLPPVILIVGAYGAVRLMQTSPRAQRGGGGEREPMPRLVEVETLSRGDEQVTVEVMGTVVPARSVELQPQLSGRVEWVSPSLEAGGYLEAGEELLRIEASDYELAVRQQRAAVAQAEGDLKIEMGQQEIARQDFELLGEEIPEEERGLVLREPQLEKARADLEAARVALEAAELDLSRTRLKAPFDCVVLSESVELGSVVSTSTVVAELAGTERFWVELAVPVDELRWIELPGPDGEAGSEVLLRDEAAWAPGRFRAGHVVRFLGDVDEESRMARLLVAVDDPFAREPENRDEPRLLLNSYVRAQILGRTVPGAVAVSREHIRQGDTVWIMDEEERLDVREVSIVWRGPERVLIQEGVDEGERLVTTRMSAPVDGMSLRTLQGSEGSATTPSGLEPLERDAAGPGPMEGTETGKTPDAAEGATHE